MKNFKRRFIAFSALIAVMLSACVSCNDKKEKTPSLTEQEKDEIAQDPLTFEYDLGGDSDSLDAADPTSPNSGNETNPDSNTENSTAPQETYIVTDAVGQPVTEIITVTEANGQSATEANGEVVTEAVTVTGVKPSTDNVTSTNTNTDTNTGANTNTNTNTNTHKPNMVTCKAWWIDVSKEMDYEFNGEFIEAEFKINESTPSGKYPINIVTPQFSNLAAKSATYPDNVYNGYVYVSQDAEQPNVNDDGKFTLYTDSVSGKPGDTVIVKFNIKNNPGLCAMFFEFEYDKNALSIVEARATGEFNEIASASIIE